MPEQKAEIRCEQCSKVLCKGVVDAGNIEIKCKCGKVNTIVGDAKLEETTKATPDSAYNGSIELIN
jgi:phage FluMu protein Com